MTSCEISCRETTSLKLAKLRGVTFVNQYVVIKYLGKGANGRVFLCLDMCDNRLYAVKVESGLLKQLNPEIQHLHADNALCRLMGAQGST